MDWFGLLESGFVALLTIGAWELGRECARRRGWRPISETRPPISENRIRVTEYGCAFDGFWRIGAPVVVEIDPVIMENCRRTGTTLRLELGPDIGPPAGGHSQSVH